MKAIIYERYGTPEVLHVKSVPVPKPKPNEVLIKVHASSINSWDYDMLTGRPKAYQLISGLGKPRYKILGADVSGVVEALGSNVNTIKIGDEVFGDLSNSGWGAYAEYVCAKSTSLALKPQSLSHTDAASLPQAGVMAWQCIYEKTNLQPGMKVLMNGAGGGIGVLLVQMAKWHDAHVSCVDALHKLPALSELGADRLIDYQETTYTNEKILYDLIVDVVADKPIGVYKNRLTRNGQFKMIGGKLSALFSALTMGNKRAGILAQHPNKYLNELANACVQGKLKPVIDSIYPLEESRVAFHHYAEGNFFGKIIIQMQ